MNLSETPNIFNITERCGGFQYWRSFRMASLTFDHIKNIRRPIGGSEGFSLRCKR